MEPLKLKLHIDMKTLSWGAVIDLEKATKAHEVAEWLVAHAGADMEQLRAIPIAAMEEVATTLAAQLTAGLDIPKANGSRTS